MPNIQIISHHLRYQKHDILHNLESDKMARVSSGLVWHTPNAIKLIVTNFYRLANQFYVSNNMFYCIILVKLDEMVKLYRNSVTCYLISTDALMSFLNKII